MKSTKKPMNMGYVTYKWLLTTIIASMSGILLLVGAIANTTFYTKSAGAAVEEKINSTQDQLSDMKIMLTEVRQDVKMILAKKGK